MYKRLRKYIYINIFYLSTPFVLVTSYHNKEGSFRPTADKTFGCLRLQCIYITHLRVGYRKTGVKVDQR